MSLFDRLYSFITGGARRNEEEERRRLFAGTRTEAALRQKGVSIQAPQEQKIRALTESRPASQRENLERVVQQIPEIPQIRINIPSLKDILSGQAQRDLRNQGINVPTPGEVARQIPGATKGVLRGVGKGGLQIGKGLATGTGQFLAKQAFTVTGGAGRQIDESVKTEANLEQFAQNTIKAYQQGKISRERAIALLEQAGRSINEVASRRAQLIQGDLRLTGKSPLQQLGGVKQLLTEEFKDIAAIRNPERLAERGKNILGEGSKEELVGAGALLFILAATDFIGPGKSSILKLNSKLAGKLATESSEQAVKSSLRRLRGFNQLDETIQQQLIKDIAQTADPQIIRQLTSRAVEESSSRAIGREIAETASKTADPDSFIKNLPPALRNRISTAAKNTDSALIKQLATDITSGKASQITRELFESIAKIESPDILQNLTTVQRAEIDKVAKQMGLQSADDLVKQIGTTRGASDISAVTESSLFASKKEAQSAKNVVEAAPKAIREKIEQGTPLTAQEAKKLNATIDRVNLKLGIAPGQRELGLGVRVPMEAFTLFSGTAKRTTKAGNILDVSRGQFGINIQASKNLTKFVQEKPNLVSRIMSWAGVNPKKARGLVHNLNSIRRKNPQLAKELEEGLFRPTLELQAKAARFTRNIRTRLIQTKKAVNLNKQQRGELKAVLDGKLNPNKTSEGVRVMAGEMRKGYDEFITALNEMEMATGVRLTPRRKDYFPHIKELLGEEKWLAPAKQADPDFIRRVGASFGFGKERTGKLGKIMDDPFEVFDIYSRVAQSRIGTLIPSRITNLIIDSLDQVRALDPRGVTQMKAWFKGINDDLTGAKRAGTLVDRFQGRIARGTVLGNASSIALNPIQAALTAAIHPIHSTKGLYNTFLGSVRAMQGGVDELVKAGNTGLESSYLRNSVDQASLSQLKDKSILRKGGDVMARSFTASDVMTKKQVLESFLSQQLAEGWSPREALRRAELRAENILPSRTPGTLATAFRESTLGRLANLFQTEVFAQWESIGEAVRPQGLFSQGRKSKALANLAGIAIAGHYFNNAFQIMFPGRRPAPDPIGWLQAALEDDESAQDSFVDNTWQFLKQGIGQLPVIGSWGPWSEFGNRSPFPGFEIAKGMGRTVGDVLTGKTDKESLLRAGRNVSSLVGRGGRPVFRAGEGLFDILTGSGDKGFTSEKNIGNIIRSAAGGSYNTPEAQAMFDKTDTSDIQDALKTQGVKGSERFLNKSGDIEWSEIFDERQNEIRRLRQQDKQKLVDAGLTSWQEVNAIETREKAIQAITGKTEGFEATPTGMSAEGRNIINRTNRLSQRGKDKFYSTADTTTTAVADRWNSLIKESGRDLEFQNKNGGVAEALAKYEKWQLDNPNSDEATKFSKEEVFLKDALKSEYSDKVRKLHGTTKADLQRLRDKGQISEAEWQQVLDLDDRLVRAELQEKHKFGSGEGTGRDISRGAGISIPALRNFLGQVSLPKRTQLPRVQIKRAAVRIPKGRPKKAVKIAVAGTSRPTFGGKTRIRRRI